MAKVKKKKEFVLRNFIIQKLRASFRECPIYTEAKKRAKEDFYIDSKHGKKMRRVRFKCATCGRAFTNPKDVAVDHLDPVITSTGWIDYNTFIEKLFCSIDNLQVLCNYKGEVDGKTSCHKEKTKKERQDAAEKRKALNAQG